MLSALTKTPIIQLLDITEMQKLKFYTQFHRYHKMEFSLKAISSSVSVPLASSVFTVVPSIFILIGSENPEGD